jgi:hypothetical protein
MPKLFAPLINVFYMTVIPIQAIVDLLLCLLAFQQDLLDCVLNLPSSFHSKTYSIYSDLGESTYPQLNVMLPALNPVFASFYVHFVFPVLIGKLAGEDQVGL